MKKENEPDGKFKNYQEMNLFNKFWVFFPSAPALATVNYVPEKSDKGSHSLSLEECFENILRAAVPKTRRSRERRMMRKLGHYKLFQKEHFNEKIENCLTCGNYYRRGFLCGKTNNKFSVTHPLIYRSI